MQLLCPECQTPLENNSSESSGNPPLWVCKNASCSKFVASTAASNLDEERIRQIVREENGALCGENTTKSYLVAGTLLLGANLLTTTIDYYDLVRLGGEVICPGSLPDLEDVAHKANEYINKKDVISEKTDRYVPKATERFLAFSEQWQNLKDDNELRNAAENSFVDDHRNQWTIISEGSGIVDPAYFDRGYQIASGTGTSEDESDDYPRVQIQDTTTTSPPPPSFGIEGLEYT